MIDEPLQLPDNFTDGKLSNGITKRIGKFKSTKTKQKIQILYHIDAVDTSDIELIERKRNTVHRNKNIEKQRAEIANKKGAN